MLFNKNPETIAYLKAKKEYNLAANAFKSYHFSSVDNNLKFFYDVNDLKTYNHFKELKNFKLLKQFRNSVDELIHLTPKLDYNNIIKFFNESPFYVLDTESLKDIFNIVSKYSSFVTTKNLYEDKIDFKSFDLISKSSVTNAISFALNYVYKSYREYNTMNAETLQCFIDTKVKPVDSRFIEYFKHLAEIDFGVEIKENHINR